MATEAKLADYCLLWIDWWPICMNKSEWASWAQATFTVLAIYFAVRTAGHQGRHASRLESERRRVARVVRIKTLHALFVNIQGVLELLRSSLARGPNAAKWEDLALLTDTADQLKALPLFEIESEMLALSVLLLPRQFAVLHSSWLYAMREEDDENNGIHLQADIDGVPTVSSTLPSLLDSCMARVRSAIGDCTRALEALAGDHHGDEIRH